MNKLTAIKLVARVVVGAGTTTISSSIIKNNVQPSSVIEQISTAVASVVIGSMASEATKAHTERQIDQLAALFKRSKSTEEPATTA